MRKISILLICIMLLTIPGCSNNKHVQNINYIFKGENDFWAAELEVKGTGTSNKSYWSGITFKADLNKTLIVTYKKDISQLSSVKHLEISYEEELGSAKTGTLQTLKEDYNNGSYARQIYILETHTKGAEVETGFTTVIVTINIDNKIQTIKLKWINDEL